MCGVLVNFAFNCSDFTMETLCLFINIETIFCNPRSHEDQGLSVFQYESRMVFFYTKIAL